MDYSCKCGISLVSPMSFSLQLMAVGATQVMTLGQLAAVEVMCMVRQVPRTQTRNDSTLSEPDAL